MNEQEYIRKAVELAEQDSPQVPCNQCSGTMNCTFPDCEKFPDLIRMENAMTLEKLLRMTVPVGPGCVLPENTPMSPEFRLSVQHIADDEVRIIVHASGHNSETLDFAVRGNKLVPL